MLFRISINFKQVQDIRDAALDKSNWIDAVTCIEYNRPSQLEPGMEWKWIQDSQWLGGVSIPSDIRLCKER